MRPTHSLPFMTAQGADGIRGLKGTKGEKVSAPPSCRKRPRAPSGAALTAAAAAVASECGGPDTPCRIDCGRTSWRD